MDKNILKQKLEETKAKLKANSKDAHFADSLINDLVSTCGQMSHKPIVVHHELGDVEGTASGKTFELNIMKDGTAIYHVYGGYTIIADVRSRSLNMALKMMYDSLKNGCDDDDATLVDAMGHVLCIPMVAFCDKALTYQFATSMLEWLGDIQDKAMSADLQDEDPDAIKEISSDLEFREAFKDALS